MSNKKFLFQVFLVIRGRSQDMNIGSNDTKQSISKSRYISKLQYHKYKYKGYFKRDYPYRNVNYSRLEKKNSGTINTFEASIIMEDIFIRGDMVFVIIINSHDHLYDDYILDIYTSYYLCPMQE